MLKKLMILILINTLFVASCGKRQDDIGVDYYLNGTYLNFEYSDKFDEMLNELDALDKGSVTDFYHTDNSWATFTLFDGAPHIFALDIEIDQDKHSINEILKDVDAGSRIKKGDYTIYHFPRQEGIETDLKVIAVCEEKSIVRYIYISEVTRLAGYDTVLVRYAVIDWGF